MELDFNSDELKNFGNQLADDAKKMSHQMFETFKDTAFPKEKSDALDYETICLIEDEFRKQEAAFDTVIDTAHQTFIDQNDEWLKQFAWTIDAFAKIALRIADSFIIGVKGLSFTYDIRPALLPTRMVEKFFQESEYARGSFFRKNEECKERLTKVLFKKRKELKEKRNEIENIFSEKTKTLLEVDLPASHKHIEAIINQNYLQRVGSLHGMN